MSLEKTMVSAPEEKLTVAEAQYNDSLFTGAYKYVRGILSDTSKKVSNFIGSYSDRLKYNLKKDHTVPYSQKQKGFTLTELLVTIAITGGLMAILLPSLQRARKEARSVVCQSNEKEMGYAFAIDTSIDKQKILPDHWWLIPKKEKYGDILLCPMAKKNRVSPVETVRNGAKFLSWSTAWEEINCSYGSNGWCGNLSPFTLYKNLRWNQWPTREPSNVPLLLDCVGPVGGFYDENETPPSIDDMPLPWQAGMGGKGFCINRHEGHINSLFSDYSVRRVGLKELWTLKWHKEFNTAGPWTKAGGVQPEDWPKWMRKFKDY